MCNTTQNPTKAAAGGVSHQMKPLLIGNPKFMLGGLIGFPPEIVRETPAIPVIVPSVAMKELTRRRVTIRPLMTPTPVPLSTPTSTAGHGPSGPCSMTATSPVSPRTDPTDRSMQPMKITSVSPSAIRPFGEDCMTVFSRFSGRKKEGTRIPATASVMKRTK